MRYLLLTYYTKPNGHIDEAMTVSTKIRTKDWQTVNVILDFKELKVLKASVNRVNATKDWDTVVSTYYEHYANIIERLFQENGHAIDIKVNPKDTSNV
jgi:aminopeptidase N